VYVCVPDMLEVVRGRVGRNEGVTSQARGG
jgi:hypothetical protein